MAMFNKNQGMPTPKNIETIIGPSVKVQGDFKGEGDLIIEGMLIGTLQTKNNLKIGENAVVEADIKANNAFISGKVKGDITVKGKLEIAGTAMILGNIRAQILSMESGALIQGQLDMPVGNISTEEKIEAKKSHSESKEEKYPEKN